jgi:hypothetical protein
MSNYKTLDKKELSVITNRVIEHYRSVPRIQLQNQVDVDFNNIDTAITGIYNKVWFNMSYNVCNVILMQIYQMLYIYNLVDKPITTRFF